MRFCVLAKKQEDNVSLWPKAEGRGSLWLSKGQYLGHTITSKY